MDRALSFGLRSAPKTFNTVADTIAWALSCQGISQHLHYFDDFLFLTTPHSQQGHYFLSVARQTLSQLGIPVAINKTERPCTALTFLGIFINCHNFELKLSQVQDMVCAWIHKRSCTTKELESLVGHLSHAATFIPQGYTFLCLLFSLLSLDRLQHQRIHLNAGTRADLTW